MCLQIYPVQRLRADVSHAMAVKGEAIVDVVFQVPSVEIIKNSLSMQFI